MSDNVVEKVLEKINNVGLKPKPKWQFLLHDWLIWLFFSATVFIGGLASSAVIFLIRTGDWDLYGRLSLPIFLKSLPFFWIAIVLIFIFLAYYNFKHTQNGYRYRFYVIVLAAVLLSFIFGLFFHWLRLGQIMDDRAARALPFYRHAIRWPNLERQMMVWSRPEMGMLAGQVRFVKNPNNFELEDLGGKIWNVFNEQEIKQRFAIELDNGIWLKALGEQIGKNNFKAVEIRPWPGPMLEFNEPIMKEKMFIQRMYR